MAGRITQLTVEVLRGRFVTDVRVSQVCVEVLVPYIPPEWKFGVAAASFTLTASAAATAGVDYETSASASFTLTAASTAERAAPVAAVASFALTAEAGDPEVVRVAAGAARIVFRVRARVQAPDAIFSEHYIGRYQVGQDLPLWEVVRNERGSPRDPTTGPPYATVYSLDTGLKVDAADLPRLRGSRVSPVHSRPRRVGPAYPPGRYAVLYRASTGAFTGITASTFEVQAGGDASGPLHAAHAVETPSGPVFLAQAGSGALVTGRRPRVD